MFGLIVAFQDFDPLRGFYGGDFVGFAHFRRFFNSHDFSNIVANTLILSLYYMVINFFTPVMLAISINEVSNRHLKKSIQTITYAPYFISTVVVVGMMFQIFSPQIGVFNQLTSALGMESVNYLGDPRYFRHLHVWSGIWQNVGFGSIIFIAALTTIDPQLYEAATVDGASRVQKIWHIDIPSIRPTMVILLILSAGRVMDVDFEKTFLMQNFMNLSTSEVISTYVYKVGLIQMDFSFSTAVGMFNSVIGLVLIVSVNFAAKWLGESGLW